MVACRAESRSYIAQQPSSISQQDAIFYPSSSSNSGYKPQPSSGGGGVSYNNNRQPYNSNTCRGCQDRPDAYSSGIQLKSRQKMRRSALIKACDPILGPVAFSASRADLYTRSASSNGNIVFDQTETDVGYGWNAQRGVFVCQTPGVYVFSWSTVSPSGTEARVSLFRDGREAGAHTWSDGKG